MPIGNVIRKRKTNVSSDGSHVGSKRPGTQPGMVTDYSGGGMVQCFHDSQIQKELTDARSNVEEKSRVLGRSCPGIDGWRLSITTTGRVGTTGS